MAENKRKNQRNPPPSSPPSPPPPLHPILNVLPSDTQFSIYSSTSPQEMEVLAYMITISFVMESLNQIPSSTKVKEALERFPGVIAAGNSATSGCRCFPCYKTYWERWASTSSANRRRIDNALEVFERSLSRWRSINGCSEQSGNSRGEDIRRSGVSMPALEDALVERSGKEDQESHRSFAGKVFARALN